MSERELKSSMSKPGLLIFSPKLILPTTVLTEVRFQTPSVGNPTIILGGHKKLGHGTDFKIPLGFRAVKMWKAKYSGINDIWVAGSSLRVSSLASYTKHAAAMTGWEPLETPTSDFRPHSFMKQGFPGNLLFTRHYGYRNEDTASAPRGIWVQ